MKNPSDAGPATPQLRNQYAGGRRALDRRKLRRAVLQLHDVTGSWTLPLVLLLVLVVPQLVFGVFSGRARTLS